MKPIGQWAGAAYDLDCSISFHGTSCAWSYADNADDSSQIFLGWDLQNNGISLKAYSLPGLKAKRTGQSRLQLRRNCMGKLCVQQSSMADAFATFSENIESRVGGKELTVEIAAIDCVEPSLSRVKVYVTCRLTSFDSVTGIMTMEGLLDSDKVRKAITSLKELWALVLGLPPNFDSSAPLRSNGHRTIGVLYYFALKPGSRFPSERFYIPVKHYGTNDLEVARSLSKFLDTRGFQFADCSYLPAMQEIL